MRRRNAGKTNGGVSNMSDSKEFKEAFNKVKSLDVNITDKEIKAILVCVDFSNQPDFSVVDGAVIPRGYVVGFVQACFENNPLLKKGMITNGNKSGY